MTILLILIVNMVVGLLVVAAIDKDGRLLEWVNMSGVFEPVVYVLTINLWFIILFIRCRYDK